MDEHTLKRLERLVNPPGIILDDNDVIKAISNYVETTKHLSKKELRKLMRGLIQKP